MGGSFACPECGSRLALEGRTPGRRVRCEWCRTWVEVPYLPRIGRGRRPVRVQSIPGWATWAWTGIALAALGLMVLGTVRILRAQSHHVRERALAQLCRAAEDDERQERFGPALASLEAAAVMAADLEPRDEARLARLQNWRDRVAQRDVETTLARLSTLAPEQAVGTCLTLQARLRAAATLARFAETVDQQLEQARTRCIAADLEAARQALKAGNAALVYERCERLAENCNALDASSVDRRQARAEADAMAALVIAQRGVWVGPIKGHFDRGSHASYEPLFPILADALRQHGYVVRPASPFWPVVWDSLAPYHLTISVTEQVPGTYLHSANRTSAINLGLVLSERGKTHALWDGTVNARTRVPMPGLPAYQARRLALNERRDSAIEQSFYQDARTILNQRLAAQLKTLPQLRTPLAPPTAQASHY
jgi:hypothetical protein